MAEHGGTGGGPAAVEEPSLAERARTLASMRGRAMLSTLSRRHAGFPFGSLMPYVLDEAGRPILLISSMAMHTQNLKADARASLFVAAEGPEGDPLEAARLTLVGRAEPVPDREIGATRALYLAAHPRSRHWVEFADFAFYRLEPAEVYYVGGFGVMGWVSAGGYAAAEPDPLAAAAAGILAHMNADHIDAMLLLARVYAGMEASEAWMTGVDRLGFGLRLVSQDGARLTRVNFSRQVRTPAEARAVLIEMVQEAAAGAPGS